VILAVALRYWWLQRRAKWRRWQPSPERWERAHRKIGQAIYGLATELGGAFVKLGQVLGSRGDVCPTNGSSVARSSPRSRRTGRS